jgi:hypothetical protein
MGVKLAGLALSIALFCPPSARADEVASYCSITVGLSSWSPSECAIREDGKTLSLHWPGAGGRKFWIELIRSADGQSAQAVWNGLESHSKADEKLGKLVLSENCWLNDNTRICFVVQSLEEELAEEAAGDQMDSENAVADEESGPVGPASSFRGIQLGMTQSQIASALPDQFELTEQRHDGDLLQMLDGFAESLVANGMPRQSVYIAAGEKMCGEVVFSDGRADRLRLYQCFFNITGRMSVEDFAQKVVDNYGIEDGMKGRTEMRGSGPYTFKYTEYVGVRRATSERFTVALHQMNNVLTLTVQRIPGVNFN